MHVILLILLCFGPFTSARVVIPDIAGMIHPSISSTSRHVQFGGLNSPSPTPYEFLASSTDSIVCDARLCLRVKISSIFKSDPFFLHQYDSTYPLVSATFDSHDPTSILPLIPGDTHGTIWWFQSNATVTGPVVDLLLRFRQRSQRLAARDQMLVVVRIELLDQHSISSAIQAYSLYGNQRVTHTTHRVDGNTIQVALSITKNDEKRDVTSLDAYPLADTDLPHSSGNSCNDCEKFLDACRDTLSDDRVAMLDNTAENSCNG
ncbi:LOW QUALITY PROTEIN: hypothetical protein PHPALM_8261 [Phytophthora palmivora]|uniref:Uncharacterized protein n=1 Tax=Phytophthora palmivora TaxID=4796 RepID=A0A2P4YA90_9STRA|nr:LOW QUALITY PROTEIN: hypothetical protein PHPALM_8261 [Phytophthora palmivora]